MSPNAPTSRVLKAVSATELPPPVLELVAAARKQQWRVVLVTGVFDLFHAEHRLFLEKAKAAGDVLVVGLEPDVRVTQTKGPSRPINSEIKRCLMLEKQQLADVVFILSDAFETPVERRAFIQTLRPDILAVSANSPHLENKQKLLAEVGGTVKVVHNHNPAISTTILLEKLAKIEA